MHDIADRGLCVRLMKLQKLFEESLDVTALEKVNQGIVSNEEDRRRRFGRGVILDDLRRFMRLSARATGYQNRPSNP